MAAKMAAKMAAIKNDSAKPIKNEQKSREWSRGFLSCSVRS